MFTCSLRSGSAGNSIYVEAGQTRLLIDAGISGRQAQERRATHNRSIEGADALLISHDHSDHVACAGVFHRRFRMPVYMTRATHDHVHGRLGKLRDVRHFQAGTAFEINDVLIHALPTPHDAVDGVVFVIEHAGKRLGIFTDLGWPFPELAATLETVDAAYLESNYDPEMLRTGPYSADLQARIRGTGGHLSNDEAAELRRACNGRHRWIALAHLSEENNRPEIAMCTHQRIAGEKSVVHLAPTQTLAYVRRVKAPSSAGTPWPTFSAADKPPNRLRHRRSVGPPRPTSSAARKIPGICLNLPHPLRA